jgi:hypothetical protein
MKNNENSLINEICERIIDDVIIKIEEENNCCICRDEIFNNCNVSITKCKHKYHFTCLLQYIEKSINDNNELKCPLCREKLNDTNNINQQSNINNNINTFIDYDIESNVASELYNLSSFQEINNMSSMIGFEYVSDIVNNINNINNIGNEIFSNNYIYNEPIMTYRSNTGYILTSNEILRRILNEDNND